MSQGPAPFGRKHWEDVARDLKSYDDPARLDRVWNRLERSKVMGAPSSDAELSVRRLFSSAALVAAGVLMGIYLERTFTSPPEFTVQSESLSRQSFAPASAGVRAERLDELQRSNAGDARREKQLTRREQSRSSTRKLSRNAQKAASAPLTDKVELPTALEAPPALVPEKAAWLSLAERGDFAGAFQNLEQNDGFDQALLAAGPDELMTLVDVARSVGRQGRAIQALRIVIDQYRDDENAPLAAMMLGNLLSRTGDASGAAEAFALNRRLSPGGDFAEDALVREFDMAITAMDLAEAERLRTQYESEYPEGRHKEALRADLDRMVQELLPAGERTSARDDAIDENAENQETEQDADRSGDARPEEEGPAPSLPPTPPTTP